MIRTAMGNAKQKEFIHTIIEMDDTYAGGKPHRKSDYKDADNNGGMSSRGDRKTPYHRSG